MGNLYRRLNNFLCTNIFIKKIIYFQHRFLPMPLWFFDALFSTKFGRLALNFYGSHIFQHGYFRRNKDQFGYWMGRESLYWHFWRQTDFNEKILGEVIAIKEVKDALNNKDNIAAEIGFGIGKNYLATFKNNNLKRYLAVEPNKYICAYVKNKFKKQNNLEIINASAMDFIKQNTRFDILIAAGGVFMYMDKDDVNIFFSKLVDKGIQVAIFINEGSPSGDIEREDGTTMYDFTSKLGGFNFKEKVKANGIFDYLVATINRD